MEGRAQISEECNSGGRPVVRRDGGLCHKGGFSAGAERERNSSGGDCNVTQRCSGDGLINMESLQDLGSTAGVHQIFIFCVVESNAVDLEGAARAVSRRGGETTIRAKRI